MQRFCVYLFIGSVAAIALGNILSFLFFSGSGSSSSFEFASESVVNANGNGNENENGNANANGNANTNTNGNAKPRNIVLYMTDDQDSIFNPTHPYYMPALNTLFREGGMEFTRFYASTALCCPSRVSILRGQYCHNTGVYDNGGTTTAPI
jgi:hypothetical protein